MRLATVLAAAALTGCAGAAGVQTSQPAPDATSAPVRDYYVYAASEATDEVSLIRFGPDGGSVVSKRETGVNPADPDGPHGVAVSPDRRYYYVTTGHGTPNGYLWKYTTVGDTLKGRVELGLFPASMDLSPDGLYVYVVNFNLHGDMVPSSVSIVSTSQMVEVARLTTCTMPHGSRVSASGAHQYSACMMDDALVQIDARTFDVARHFMLTPGSEHGMSGAPGGHGMGGMAGGSAGGAPQCSPTWAVPSPDGSRVYVACNAANDIAEIDVATWKLVRRIPAGDGVYNLDVTYDGRLLIGTNKKERSVSVIDIATGRELARIPTKRTVVHGVTISDDDRYAFISVEGYGAEPGTVEVIDLAALKTVATVDIGQMATGIDFWKSEARR